MTRQAIAQNWIDHLTYKIMKLTPTYCNWSKELVKKYEMQLKNWRNELAATTGNKGE